MKKATGTPHPRAQHPLFPYPADAADADMSDRDISWIYISRNGEYAPTKFGADELTEEEQIHALYGGGVFKLQAKDENRARWTATREIKLPGPAKPLDPNLQNPAQVPNTVATMSMDGQSSPWVKDVAAVVGLLGPIVVGLINASAQRAQAEKELMVQLLTQRNTGQNDAIMATVLQAALARQPANEMVQLLQTGMQMGATVKGEGGDNDVFGQFLAGMQEFNEMKRLELQQNQQQPPQQPKPVPAPKP